MAILPLVNREIPIVADYYVDKEFGTGAVKITPAHDPNDFEVGKRHNLPEINIMNDDATINEKGGKYAGMDRYEARKAIVADLDEQGYLVKVVPHMHAVGTHDRCGTTVEPLIKQQWFVKMDELAKPAINALKTGELRFVPERFDKIYLHCSRISRTGVFPVRSGGDIGFRLTTVMSAVNLLWQERCRKNARIVDAHISRRTRIHWIHGSLPHCGRSPHLAGRTRQKTWIISIRQMYL